MYACATKRLNIVLKCFEGPANIVRPGVKPPSNLPDNATFIMGTSVGIISFSVKKTDWSNIAVSLMVLFFFNLSSNDI